MKSCVLLTMDNMNDFECYDSLLIEPLEQLGWRAEEISWRTTRVDWNQFDAVIIRSPWDYQDDSDAFMSVLKEIEKSNAVLLNCIDLVAWNINKKYLAELEKNGILIVPTVWGCDYSQKFIESAIEIFKEKELIVKPCVSAGASDTFRLNFETDIIDHEKLETLFTDRDFMIQPFVSAIVDEGEYSLFYFNREYSHAILKKPYENDFRVQEEFGSHLSLIEPERLLTETAKEVLTAIPYETLYARLDFVRLKTDTKEEQFALMEAELIEPSLYFNMDSQSAERFALAFVRHYEKLQLL
ncbi:MAG: hypothetical protein ACJAS9_000548 [Polaribacter sp.]|jgi:hypothetical protein